MIFDSLSGMPTSPVTVSAISSARPTMPSWTLVRSFARCSLEVALQLGKAARAASTAASASSAVAAGTHPITSSLAALKTSIVSVPPAATHWPFT